MPAHTKRRHVPLLVLCLAFWSVSVSAANIDLDDSEPVSIKAEEMQVFSPDPDRPLPGAIVLLTNAGITFRHLTVEGDRLVFDGDNRRIEGELLRVRMHPEKTSDAEVQFATSITSSAVTSLQCRPRPGVGSELVVNGQGTGTFPTTTNPDRTTIPGALIACQGRDVLMVVGGTFTQQEP